MAGSSLRAWRRWQLSRPFWGGLLVIAAGAELLVAMSLGRAFRLAAEAALAGPVPILLAGGLVACGLLTWFHPVQRSAYATAAILIATAALMTADVGGFVLGTLIGAAGGSVAFAWVPAGHGGARRERRPAPQGEDAAQTGSAGPLAAVTPAEAGAQPQPGAVSQALIVDQAGPAGQAGLIGQARVTRKPRATEPAITLARPDGAAGEAGRPAARVVAAPGEGWDGAHLAVAPERLGTVYPVSRIQSPDRTSLPSSSTT
jgi:hypothetical protein